MDFNAESYAFFAFAYLLGSIPFGLVLTRFAGIGDIRSIGSGNIGATNVLRTGNKKLAFFTLLLDIIKGVIPILIAKFYISIEIAAIAGVFAVLGHLFPIWLKFKGGKGVATTLGILLAINLPVGLFACATWLLVFLAFHYSSLSSISAMIAAAITAYYLSPIFVFYAILTLAILVIIRHHANIKRLINGEESKSRFKKSS